MNGIELFMDISSNDVLSACGENASPILAIDEIQQTLEGSIVHKLTDSSNERPFPPLLLETKEMGIFINFMIAGTGMNFELIQECLSSASFKKEKFDYQLIMGFKPLCKQSERRTGPIDASCWHRNVAYFAYTGFDLLSSTWNATILLPNDHASYALHCGLGFVNSAEDRTLNVVNILQKMLLLSALGFLFRLETLFIIFAIIF
ncbi:hypothetical protein MIR68_003435 [Amoeboaphelidium protococcarum]|nr:hypothetical protein MIR68_003435 [Amoeboaphelidium protococcarum]